MIASDPTGPGDPLDPIVADYLQQLEAGQMPDREAFIAEHPDLADRLRAFFEDLDRVGKQASAFRLPDPESTVGDGGPSDLPRVRYLGDYELLEEIARGGMGVVYKARQVSLNRVVALKLILAGTYASEAAIQRFRAEAEAAAGLDHPNILPIHEIGNHDGHQFFSMKLVSGTNLGDTIGQLKTRPRDTAALLETLARAVHFAHRRGILHRDLKPANVLIAKDGTLYVSDFGLAKKVNSDDGSTRTGAVVGTPAYMAPEQARGSKGLTVAVDVYSLGAILYEAVTGRPPFRGDTVLDTLRLVTDTEPAHPQSVYAAADRDLSVIALKCLEKDPAKRYPSAEALADDLGRWLKGEPIEARPATAIERGRKWVRRNPFPAALGGMAVAGVIGLFFFLMLSLKLLTSAIRSETAAMTARNDAMEAQQASEAAKDLSDRRLYAAQTVIAQSALDQVQVRQARKALDATDPARRGWEWHYLNWAADPSRTTVEAGGTKKALRFSADGRRLFWASEYWGLFLLDAIRPEKVVRWIDDRLQIGASDDPIPNLAVTADLGHAAFFTDAGLHLYEAGSDKPVVLIPEREKNDGVLVRAAVAFSIDGRHLYAARDKKLTCWDVSTHERVWEKPVAPASVTALAVSPTEDRVALGFDEDNTVRVIDLQTRAEVFKTPRHLNLPNEIEFTPDGGRLVTHGPFRSPYIWELGTGKELLLSKASWGARYALSRDGKLGVIGMSFGDVVIFDAVTGREMHICRGHTNYINAVAVSPDKTLVASGGRDKTVRVWNVADGSLRELFVAHAEGVSALAFSPDGKTLVSAAGDRTVKFWPLDDPRPMRQFPKTGYDIHAWHLMRDGRRVLLAQGKSKPPITVDVWDVDTGKVVRDIGPHTGGDVYSLALSADERWLVAGTSGGTVHLWDFADGRGIRSHTLRSADKVPDPGPGGIGVVAISADGSKYAYGQPDGLACVRDRETGRELWTTEELASKEWADGKENQRQMVRSVWFSPDGRRVVIRWFWSSSRLTIHDAATGERIGEPIEGDRDAPFAFSADGKVIAAVADRTTKAIQLLDVETGTEVGRFPQARTVSALAFAPDGKRLAMGLWERTWNNSTIEVADVATGSVVFEARGHGSYVSSLAYFPDGSRLVSGGFDNTVNIWAAEDGQALLTLPFSTKGDDRVEHVMVSPDGTKVFATNGFPEGGSGGRNVVTVWRSK